MTPKDISEFAAAAVAVVKQTQDMLHKEANANAELRKQLSQGRSTPLERGKLLKAASAVLTVYGNPSTISADQMADFWEKDPNNMVNTIQKLASARIEQQTLSGDHLGKPVHKQSSAESGVSADADSVLRSKYS